MRQRRCILLPIEPIEQRYTAQWLEWWPAALTAAGFDVQALHPIVSSGSVTREQFLDPLQTHAYKAAQVEALVEALQRSAEPATVVFLDAWHPGVISAAYMRDVAGLRLDLVGILHAGTYDEHDRLARAGCGAWARGFEASVLGALGDTVVATNFHKGLLRAAGLPTRCVTVMPLPVRTPPDLVSPRRERLVVWPHRMVPEKQTGTWRLAVSRLRAAHPGWRFEETLAATSSKAEYLALLGRAYLCVSAALQETFGIAMIEAAQLGCRILAPRRLSYPELLEASCLSNGLDTADGMVLAIEHQIAQYEDEAGPACYDCPATREEVRDGDRRIAEHWLERQS